MHGSEHPHGPWEPSIFTWRQPQLASPTFRDVHHFPMWPSTGASRKLSHERRPYDILRSIEKNQEESEWCREQQLLAMPGPAAYLCDPVERHEPNVQDDISQRYARAFDVPMSWITESKSNVFQNWTRLRENLETFWIGLLDRRGLIIFLFLSLIALSYHRYWRPIVTVADATPQQPETWVLRYELVPDMRRFGKPEFALLLYTRLTHRCSGTITSILPY